jgi:hypothetical protein
MIDISTMKINMSSSLHNDQSGITLLITLLLMGVLLGIGATLLNITLKQLQLSSIALESEVAFQAANAGVECILYYDFVDPSHPFDVFGNGDEQANAPSISCMGSPLVSAADDVTSSGKADEDESGTNTKHNGKAASGDEQRFRFEWSNRCTEVSVYKFFLEDDLDGTAEGTPVEVDNQPMRPDCPEGSECTVVQSRGYNVLCGDINNGSRVVEREYTQVY